jgi:hypothetical protein
MKKLKLKAFELSATGVLTRDQLRNVMGKGSIGANCYPDGPNNPICGSDICLNGHCAPAPDNCTYNGCPWSYYCLNGVCVR